MIVMRRRLWSLGFYLAVVVIVVVALFPVYILVITSLSNDANRFGLNLVPEKIEFTNYLLIFQQRGILRSLANSVLVGAVTTGASLGLSVLAAYALGRVRFAGRSLLLMTILACSMFPQVAVLAGMFELARSSGLYNSIWAVVLAQTAFTLPFTVWLLTAFMRDLPVEVEEAAIVDGATPLVLIVKIFLPLLAPAMVTTGLLAFVASWNEFLFALTLTVSENMRTAPIMVAMINPMAFHETAAASVLVTAPAVVLVLVFQRRIVAGLTTGNRVR